MLGVKKNCYFGIRTHVTFIPHTPMKKNEMNIMTQMRSCGVGRCGGGGGGGGGGLGGWRGIIFVRVCEPVFQNLLHSYNWILKNGPIHILDHLKC